MKKGISPLIAVVLLIVATIAIATLIINWMSDYTKETTAAVGNTSSVAVECSSASIDIIENFGGTGNGITAVVQNTGLVDLTLSNVTGYDAMGNLCSFMTASQSLTKGQIYNAEDSDCTLTIKKIEAVTNCAGVGDTKNL
jgi:flagellin-like protein